MIDQKKEQVIFIVEDDTDLAEMLIAYFRVQGYQVENATRGRDAVKQIQEKVPDIIVLDIRLPDIDGYEVCRQLRQGRLSRHIPVIFLTEKRERDDKLAGLELGAVDYITKPFDIQELRLRVRNALRRSRFNTFLNPVTGLPEGLLVQERLEEFLNQSDWGVVLTRIGGLRKFRDKFGFVAADDVSRAVTLMITNAIRESGDEDSFIGHADTTDYIILTKAADSKRLARRCRIRLEPSIQYFYPALERTRINELPESERLRVHVSSTSSREVDISEIGMLFEILDKMPRV